MLFLNILAALSFLPAAALAADVGSSGTLSSLDGGLGGTVKVTDKTTLTISDYKLKDASAPALYWWGSTTDDLSSGFRISNEQVTKPASTNSATIKLDAGKTAADFSVVGLWCEKLNANFGQATLSKDGQAGMAAQDKKVKGAASSARASSYMVAAVAVLGSALCFAW